MSTTSRGTRVPRKQSAFDQYIRAVVAFLLAGTPTNGSRLLLIAAEIAQAQGFLTLWYTGNASSPGAWELHSNPNTKTKNTHKMVVKIMKDFTVFFNPLLVRMSGSAAITAADRLILNIAAPNATRTHHRESLQEIVYFVLKPLGGGDVRMICRTTHDSKRASKAALADSVQVCYKTSDPAPVNSNDPTAKIEFYTHASFTLRLGTAVEGQKLYLFVRWYNTKHPELAGPWSPLAQVVIT